MTATLLALLVKDGAISWNSTLQELLPDLSVHPDHRNTTLATLTSHRAGIFFDWTKDRNTLPDLYSDSLDPADGRLLLTQKALSVPPALPKFQFHYENLDYIISGVIIDRYSGLPWEVTIRNRLWHPLEMQACGLGSGPESSMFSIDNPWPHRYSKTFGPLPLFVPLKYRDNPPSVSSAGTVHCPVEAYAKFLHFHATQERDNAVGLRPEDFKFLHTPLWIDEKEVDESVYTPGAWIRDINSVVPGEDKYVLTHKGSNTLNMAMAWIVVDGGSGGSEAYAAMTNVGDVGEAVEDVVDVLKTIKK